MVGGSVEGTENPIMIMDWFSGARFDLLETRSRSMFAVRTYHFCVYVCVRACVRVCVGFCQELSDKSLFV